PTKMGFCKQTQKNSLDFLAVCISTARQLIHTGPAAVIADKVDVRKKDAVSSQIKGFRDRTKEKKKELGVDADEHYDESDAIVDAPKGVAGIIDGDSIVKAETSEEEDQRLLIEQVFEALENGEPLPDGFDVFKLPVPDVEQALAEQNKPKSEMTVTQERMDDAFKTLQQFNKKVDTLLVQKQNIHDAEVLFQLPETPFVVLGRVEHQLKNFTLIFNIWNNVNEKMAEWGGMQFSRLDVEELQTGTTTLTHRLAKLPSECTEYLAYQIVKDRVEAFKKSIPLFQSLRSDSLRPRHWKRLVDVTGESIEVGKNGIENLSLSSLIAMDLSRHIEKIEEIVGCAYQELKIEKKLDEIKAKWESIMFELAEHSKGNEKRGFILKTVDTIVENLEESTSDLQGMNSSAFVAPFASEVRTWEKRIALVSEVSDLWIRVQIRWLYLEGIFVGADDIKIQLPAEAKRFETLDKIFRKLMIETSQNRYVIQACNQQTLSSLSTVLQLMDTCEKKLRDYLATKRASFARFYFISNDELLSILGTSDPSAVQPHMSKLYLNTARILMEGNNKVVGMESAEKETFPFASPVMTEGAVEVWMGEVEKEMRKSLHAITKKGVYEYAHCEYIEWLFSQLGMVGLAGDQIWWTWEVEDAFKQVSKGNVRAMKNLGKKMLSKITMLVEKVRDDLTSHQRKKINTLIIIQAHSKDIVDRFIRDSILESRSFAWESQLRYYWDRDVDDIRVRQCTGSLLYGYEFIGLLSRLVITPLTDRCVMTLTQALTMYLGGSPAGPAGTGKTETVKDLAKNLALPCYVLNCSSTMDVASLTMYFAGLSQVGAWGVMDEFNRIEASVLSVLSAQIASLQQALATNAPRCTLGKYDVRLNSKVGIFITMNPGYAGRTELPDNLKALFRPVVMVRPDLELICENMLFSEGFRDARALAKKMVVLYAQAQEQLSKQHHYDFGLRALKSVLVMAGSLMRGAPEHDEAAVIMRALRDMNKPKFIYDDTPLFQGLIQDLFPSLHCPRVPYAELNDAIKDAILEMGLEILEIQVDKVVQLYETMQARHATMVVGPTSGGKSVVIKALSMAQTSLQLKTVTKVINPKAQTVNELYGVLDPVTHEWTDGLLSNMFRTMNNTPIGEGERIQKNLLFDGDVDTLWIENLNSVLDDS
ncbi:Dynein-1-alpha heavy chain, flagellar inner arm I1 complex, partial [Aduncisulcus paluster]